MTTADLTVYGKRIGSLWDRRIGGRYELVEITDNGGAGLWVKLRRVDGGHELAMSVHNLGLNYVCVPEQAEPAEDEHKSYPIGAVRHVEHTSETVIAAKARVKKAVDAEKKARADAALIRPPIESFDEHDFGDLVRIGAEV